jgi:hypothetical protein
MNTAWYKSLVKKCMILAVVLCLALPRPVMAQSCEIGTLAAAGVLNQVTKLILSAMQAAVIAVWHSTIEELNDSIRDGQNNMRSALVSREFSTQPAGALEGFWDGWKGSMQAQTAERVAGMMDQARQDGTFADAQQIGKAAKRLQKREMKIKREMEPVEEGCTFDSKATVAAEASRVAAAMKTALSNQLRNKTTNKSGTAAAKGSRGERKDRWGRYVQYFCDVNANAGRPAGPNGNECLANQNPDTGLVNAHILPSKVLFGKETIDMTNTGQQAAVEELIYNITGLQVPEPIPGDTVAKVGGKQQRDQNREYAAQADVILSVPGMIVAERAPSPTAPTQPGETNPVTETRKRNLGADAENISLTPSEKEIRQSKIEELWDPAFYAGLSGNAKSIAEKELYLQAMNVAQIYRLLEKTEKISLLYAIQTGNLLRKNNTSADGAIERATQRREAP